MVDRIVARMAETLVGALRTTDRTLNPAIVRNVRGGQISRRRKAELQLIRSRQRAITRVVARNVSDERAARRAYNPRLPAMPSNRYTNAINLGDWVAVFTGRDYTAVAFVGVVLSLPTDESPDFVVHIPKFNKYCLAGEADLLGVYETRASPNDAPNQSDLDELVIYNPIRDQNNSPRGATFAEITFVPRDNASTIAGTVRTCLGTKFGFDLARTADGSFGAELISRELERYHRVTTYSHLTVYCPERDHENHVTWVDLLRRALTLDHIKTQLDGLNKQSFGRDSDFEVRQ